MADINIGAITEELNNKVDLDGSWGTPGDNVENLTLPASGQRITAPGDGYLVFRKITSGSNQWIELVNTTSSKYTGGMCASPNSGGYLLVTCPCKKGDSVLISYNAGGNTDAFRFVYAQKTN